jgi:hypothetical protein
MYCVCMRICIVTDAMCAGRHKKAPRAMTGARQHSTGMLTPVRYVTPHTECCRSDAVGGMSYQVLKDRLAVDLFARAHSQHHVFVLGVNLRMGLARCDMDIETSKWPTVTRLRTPLHGRPGQAAAGNAHHVAKEFEPPLAKVHVQDRGLSVHLTQVSLHTQCCAGGAAKEEQTLDCTHRRPLHSKHGQVAQPMGNEMAACIVCAPADLLR